MEYFKDIEERIAQIERVRGAEEKMEFRILEEAKKVYERQEKEGLGSFDSLMKELKLEAAAVERLFATQERDARGRLEATTPRLQLNEEELRSIRIEQNRIAVLDPCHIVHSTARCQPLASSIVCSHWETPGALGSCSSCTPSPWNNECNPRAEAFGQGSQGWRTAQVRVYFYFNIAARPQPAMVQVNVLVYLHGLYVLQTGTFGSSQLTLDLEARGYQYGVSWGSATSNVLNLSGHALGRLDTSRVLNFNMPVGQNDPFLVRVCVALDARAKKGGSSAVGDFGTGNGNFITVAYANTYSEP